MLATAGRWRWSYGRASTHRVHFASVTSTSRNRGNVDALHQRAELYGCGAELKAGLNWLERCLAKCQSEGPSPLAVVHAPMPPDIVTAIIDGDQPPELTAITLMRNTRLPLSWEAQRKRLGFAPT